MSVIESGSSCLVARYADHWANKMGENMWIYIFLQVLFENLTGFVTKCVFYHFNGLLESLNLLLHFQFISSLRAIFPLHIKTFSPRELSHYKKL